MSCQLPSYPIVSPPEWCVKYVGIPYELGARGWEKTDCWGLNWLVMVNQFGVDAPSYDGIVWTKHDADSRESAGGSIRQRAFADFDKVEAGHEQPGDTIILRIGRYPLHCGIVVVPGWMLHAAEDADSALERYDNLVWRYRVDGFWRLRQ